MLFYIAVTDNEWYKYLSECQPDEVNFWKPGGQTFKSISPGSLFLFKLHAPFNFITGGGYFVRFEILPLSLAWDAFAEKNGTSSLAKFRALIQKYRKANEFNPRIGCVILNEPFFLPRKHWITIPDDWSYNIVSGKTYDTNETNGSILWDLVQEKLNLTTSENKIREFTPQYVSANVYGKEYLQRARLGQGAFRVMVTSAYHGRCAISGEKTLPVLEAAHIKPFADNGPNSVNNGVSLRSDMHKLFDVGYLTVTPEYRILVSPKIKEEFENGKNYYPFHGENLTVLPDSPFEKPAKDYLEWHNSNIYRG